MNRIFQYTLIAGLTLVFSGFHNADPPHGGTIVEATHGYHIEKVCHIGAISFYLLDKDGKTTIASKALSGRVTLLLKDQTEKSRDLVKANGEALNLKERGINKHVKSCVVTIQYDGKSVTAKFN
jgi:hypothetical protein